MKKTLLLVIFAIGASSISSMAEDAISRNVLGNPGFEDVEMQDVDTTYAELLERGVEMSAGSSVPMPAGWRLNDRDGWYKGKSCVFRYVEGEPGKEVFKGQRAVYLASSVRATITAKQVKVTDSPRPDEPTVKLQKANHFSFYAKGSGKISAGGYTYGDKDPAKFDDLLVTPETFSLTEEWQKYEGTIELTYEGIGAFAFVLVVKGEATVDEVELIGF